MNLRTTSTGTQVTGRSVATATPSPPSARELAILRRILGAATVPGVEQLLAQLPSIEVAPGSDATCRIYLVPSAMPRSTFAHEGRSALPTPCPVRSPSGRVIGNVTVWVQQGHLCALHYVQDGPNDAMVLPAPEQIELPPNVPIAIRVRAAQQALSGVSTIGADPVRAAAQPAATARPGTGTRRLWAFVAVLCIAALAAAAFLTAAAQGVDTDAPRAAGAASGAALGAEHGTVEGRFAGDTEGRLAGRNATYPVAFTTARDRELAGLRRAALERQRAQAATATVAAVRPPVSTDNTSCSGYRDARGYWICS